MKSLCSRRVSENAFLNELRNYLMFIHLNYLDFCLIKSKLVLCIFSLNFNNYIRASFHSLGDFIERVELTCPPIEEVFSINFRDHLEESPSAQKTQEDNV